MSSVAQTVVGASDDARDTFRSEAQQARASLDIARIRSVNTQRMPPLVPCNAGEHCLITGCIEFGVLLMSCVDYHES